MTDLDQIKASWNMMDLDQIKASFPRITRAESICGTGNVYSIRGNDEPVPDRVWKFLDTVDIWMAANGVFYVYSPPPKRKTHIIYD